VDRGLPDWELLSLDFVEVVEGGFELLEVEVVEGGALPFFAGKTKFSKLISLSHSIVILNLRK
jgi:hypothetical protein